MFAAYARSGDVVLRDQLVAAHMGLAAYLARRFANRGQPLEDLVQVASVGLLKAVDRFDPGLGVEFSTYATTTIVGELKRHLRDRGWAVRAPRRMQDLYLTLGQVIDTLSQELGRSPTISELAVEVQASEEEVLEALEAGQALPATSGNAWARTTPSSTGPSSGRRSNPCSSGSRSASARSCCCASSRVSLSRRSPDGWTSRRCRCPGC
jgi:RNA polymerase sigma factor (sigma-70 family)